MSASPRRTTGFVIFLAGGTLALVALAGVAGGLVGLLVGSTFANGWRVTYIAMAVAVALTISTKMFKQERGAK